MRNGDKLRCRHLRRRGRWAVWGCRGRRRGHHAVISSCRWGASLVGLKRLRGRSVGRRKTAGW